MPRSLGSYTYWLVWLFSFLSECSLLHWACQCHCPWHGSCIDCSLFWDVPVPAWVSPSRQFLQWYTCSGLGQTCSEVQKFISSGTEHVLLRVGHNTRSQCLLCVFPRVSPQFLLMCFQLCFPRSFSFFHVSPHLLIAAATLS